MKKGILILLLLIFFSGLQCRSQYYVTGQDPASIRWKQIKTSHFRLIFPESFSGMSGHYANLLEKSYSNVLTLYPEAKAKIPVIIHNYSMISNGYVSWAPKRMELYPLPGQNNLPDDPSATLVMHEMTHVAEISSLNKGFTQALSILLGQQSVGLPLFALPEWALEGDAVYAETLFSHSGRGRSVAFMQEAKALAMSEKGMYDYSKMLFGSYRDFTPDHYVFGFAMMNYLRTYYPGFWEKNIAFTGRNSYLIVPTNISLKNRLKINKNTLYQATFDSLLIAWNNTEKRISSGKYASLNPDKDGEYENYFSPYLTSDGSVAALKTSLSEPPQFVLIDTINRTEKRLLTPANIYPYFFSLSCDKIAWAELHTDPRWENLDYSIIKILDLHSATAKQLTFRTRYTAPAISPDGKLIAAVNTSPELQTSLVILDISSGNLIEEATAPEKTILQRPEWAENGKSIVLVSLSAEGEGVLKYNTLSKDWSVLIEASHKDIVKAEFTGTDLYLLMQDSVSDNIFKKTDDNEFRKITFSKFGISSFSISGNNICSSEYSADGFNVIRSSTITLNNINYNCYISDVYDNNDSIDIVSESDTVSYEIKPYHKTFHLFNFHSWAPLYFDFEEIQTDPTSIRPGFTLLSQNHLSTLISSLAYEYEAGSHILHSKITWQGWYPVIEAGISYGGKQHLTKPSNVTSYPSDISHNITFNSAIYIPLRFSYGEFNQVLMPFIYTDYINRYVYVSDIKQYDKHSILITPRLYFSNTYRTAFRDIYPRWGQIFDIRSTSAPWDKDIYHSFTSFKGIAYFPGFIKNHGIRITVGYDNQYPAKELLFVNKNNFPRGINNLIAQTLTVFTADYTMPIFYPDLSVGSLLYLKRIRASAFYDAAKAGAISDYNIMVYFPDTKKYSSIGGELLADFYLLRIPGEISAGISAGYMPTEKKSFIEGVFSVNMFGSTLGRKR